MTQIKERLSEGATQVQVARSLGITQSALSQALKYKRASSEDATTERVGRFKVSPRLTRVVAKWFRTGEAQSLSEGVRLLKQRYDIEVSKSTLRRLLHRARIVCIRKLFKFKLTDSTIKRRRAWAAKYLNWNVDQWRRAIFSDEAYLRPYAACIQNAHKWVSVDSVAASNLIEVVNCHARFKIGAWGAITSAGAGPLVVIEGSMNSEAYVSILRDNLEEAAQLLQFPQEEIFFRHDNAPYHKSGVAVGYLQETGYQILDFPHYSPDLNIIETVWANLQKAVSQHSSVIHSREDLVRVS